MNHPSTRSCVNCTSFDDAANTAPGKGLCRFIPPSMTVHLLPDGPAVGPRGQQNLRPVYFAAWSQVDKTDWCGQFSPAIQLAS